LLEQGGALRCRIILHLLHSGALLCEARIHFLEPRGEGAAHSRCACLKGSAPGPAI
jgi:hypothetical protein